MNNRYNNGCCPNAPCDYPRSGNIYLEVSIASDKGIKMDDMHFILKFYVYGNSESRYINKNQMATSEGKYYAVLHEDELMTGWLFCDVEILESVEEWPKVKKPVTARVNTGILLGGCCESHPANPNVGQCGGEGYKITVTRVKEIPYIPEEGEQDKHECCLTSEECWAEYFGLPELIADRAVADEKGNRIVDTYVTRFAAAQYIRSVFNDMFTNNPPMILEGYITPEMLSDAVINLLKANGTSVTNLPDGEDLTTIHGVLKLSNKQYNAGAYSGLGRQYLRKNLVGGQNVLTQSMINKPNTIYIIQYDYDLQGAEITIPEDCVLDFQGGSLSNGHIVYHNTYINGNYFKYIKVSCSGYIVNNTVTPQMYGAVGDGITDDTNAIQRAIDNLSHSNMLFIPVGTYAINTRVKFLNLSNFAVKNKGIFIPIAGDYGNIGLLSFDGCKSFKVENLKFNGNKENILDRNDFGVESMMNIINCSNAVFNNLEAKNTMGCVVTGASNNNLSFINVIAENIGEHVFYFGGAASHNILFSNLNIKNIGVHQVNDRRETNVIKFRFHTVSDELNTNIYIKNFTFSDEKSNDYSESYQCYKEFACLLDTYNFIIENGSVNGKYTCVVRYNTSTEHASINNIKFEGRCVLLGPNNTHGDNKSSNIENPNSHNVWFNSCELTPISDRWFFTANYNKCKISAEYSDIGNDMTYINIEKCTLSNCKIYTNGHTLTPFAVKQIILENCDLISLSTESTFTINSSTLIRFVNVDDIVKVPNNTRKMFSIKEDKDVTFAAINSNIRSIISNANRIKLDCCNWYYGTGYVTIFNDKLEASNITAIYGENTSGFSADHFVQKKILYSGSDTLNFNLGDKSIRKLKVDDIAVITKPLDNNYSLSISDKNVLSITRADVSNNVEYTIII